MSEIWQILIVDDSQDDRADLRQMMLKGSQRRYRFTEAQFGTDGLQKIGDGHDGRGSPYDCVLLDYQLPDMDAPEVLAILCQGLDLPPCPVVVVTGWDGVTNGTGPKLLRAGAQDYISKGWTSPESLTRAVENAVERFALLTERKQAEVALKAAIAAADKANLAKSEFLSSMSHELRTPLSAILGFAQLIESGTPLPTLSQKRSVDQILQAGWYLLELINEILDLSLIESGELSLTLQPMSLPEVMQECRLMFGPQADQRGISMRFPQAPVPLFVMADRMRMKQILVNLLSNAIKYNTAGGTIDVSCKEVSPERIRICLEDTGEGLSPDKISQLFQPFNRLGQEALQSEGTGIGLVMTKRLVELMGGAMGVESTVGKGSVFWFEMNRTPEPVLLGVAPDRVTPPAAKRHSHAPFCTLLYVEDNASNMTLVNELVARRPDMRLLTASEGNHGVEIARACLPDVILMDINLPGISGMDVLKILRQDPVTAHIPVLALTANAMPHDIERGLDAGFFRYLTKPIKINEFMATLDAACDSAKTALDRESKTT